MAGDHKSHGNQKSSPQQNSNHHHDLLDYDHNNQNSNNNSQKSGDNKHGNLLDFDGVFWGTDKCKIVLAAQCILKRTTYKDAFELVGRME